MIWLILPWPKQVRKGPGRAQKVLGRPEKVWKGSGRPMVLLMFVCLPIILLICSESAYDVVGYLMVCLSLTLFD